MRFRTAEAMNKERGNGNMAKGMGSRSWRVRGGSCEADASAIKTACPTTRWPMPPDHGPGVALDHGILLGKGACSTWEVLARSACSCGPIGAAPVPRERWCA